MIELRIAGPADAEVLVETCISAFHADHEFLLPGTPPGGPPGYDSPEWQIEMMKQGFYYTILYEGEIVGGLILFDLSKFGRSPGHWNLGRIWVDASLQGKGIGQEVIRLMFEKHPEAKFWQLDTPVWAVRNHHFYEKAGFRLERITEVDSESGFASHIYEWGALE